MQSVHSVIAALDKRVQIATLTAMQDAAEEVKERGLDVVSEWTNKVDFGLTTTIAATYIEILIKPTGSNKKIWEYVDLGTGRWGKNHAPYTIVPKTPGKLLKFRTGYSAKTAPIARANVGTGIASGDWVQTASVLHPGIESRKFSETFAKQLTPPLDERVTLEIRRIV